MGGSVKKITKSVSNVAKNPTNASAYGDLGLRTVTGGMVGMDSFGGGLTDALLGKKSGGKNVDPLVPLIRAQQAKGIGELNKALSTPADQIVREQAAQQTKGLITAAQDARRRAQQLMAQRGLQNSSIGLGQDRAITQRLGEQQASLQASLPGMIRSQALQDAQTRIGVGGLGTPTGIQWQKQEGQRSGGALGIASALAPIAGAMI